LRKSCRHFFAWRVKNISDQERRELWFRQKDVRLKTQENRIGRRSVMNLGKTIRKKTDLQFNRGKTWEGLQVALCTKKSLRGNSGGKGHAKEG